jgi:glycosyltransferase involved in cell wall biosynthesis
MLKPEIVMVANHACIRVQKMALPLLDKGYRVHLVARKLPSFYESYTTVSIFNDAGQLQEVIKNFEKAGVGDVYHVHNEPSWFVTLLKEMTSKPVILDVHDSFLTRSTPEENFEARQRGENPTRIVVEERTNFQIADALVFVSDTVKNTVSTEFRLNQPSIVLPSYVPLFMYKYNFGKWMGGLVYEGKVIRLNELKSNRATGFHYCDYRDTANQCKSLGVDFHLYAGGHEKELEGMYGESAFIHPGYAYRDLLTCVSRHDWGLVGNTLDSPQWQQTLPNKLYEYIACGVPVVSINAKESSQVIQDYGVGITVGSIKELTERWSEHRRFRENLIKIRQSLAMENQISVLENLYKSLV